MLKFFKKIFTNDKHYPALYAIGAGLYPIFFYYSNNFTLVNTLMHLGYFIIMFLVVPIVLFVVINWCSKLPVLIKWRKYILPFSNIFLFLFLLKVCLYGDFQKKISLTILILSFVIAYFLHKEIKKIVVIQLLLAIIGMFTLVSTVINQNSKSKEWMVQPDNIAQVVFKKKPNVYYIQPDGYVNFSELNKGLYNIDNVKFEEFLKTNNFKYYNNFRSNYAFTLSSNSSSLMMKHHYYKNVDEYREVLFDRDIVISKNTVLDVFKNNNYKTHFLTEMPYLLLSKPEMGFDACNINYDDISYIGRGFGEIKDILQPLTKYMEVEIEKPKFFFIQILAPGHITGQKAGSKGVEWEKSIWKKNLKRSNEMLTKTVAKIIKQDPEALIIITADHGGYVGMEYTLDAYTKTQDRDKIYSMFSSTLAIHWPNLDAPDYDSTLKTSVNLFRVVFSFLSQDNSYLSNLQSNSSYVILRKGVSKGVYEYIDENGNIILKKYQSKLSLDAN